jgi:hypothetical protein
MSGTGQQTAVLQHEQEKGDDNIVGSVAWHPGGKQIATGRLRAARTPFLCSCRCLQPRRDATGLRFRRLDGAHMGHDPAVRAGTANA